MSSPEHYRSWVVFVKQTRSKRITDTVFFKHKYITQPTVTPEDAVVNAYQNLENAIKGINSARNAAQLEALKRLEDMLKPGNSKAIPEQHRPRVEPKQMLIKSQFQGCVSKSQEIYLKWNHHGLVVELPQNPVA
jgi:hypothetical protein